MSKFEFALIDDIDRLYLLCSLQTIEDMFRLLFLLLVSCSAFQGWACMNEYSTRLTGRVEKGIGVRGAFQHGSIPKKAVRKHAKQLLLRYYKSDSIEYYSDYAVRLVQLGEYQLAKKVYLEIEQRKPNQYITASNLGTVYELIGKPDSALIWIKHSLSLNPNSHNGSEWIHVAILEFKLGNRQEYNHSILQLNFGKGNKPTNPLKIDLFELERDLFYQLNERTQLVKPKDLIVGNLYFDYGNTIAQTSDVESALDAYHEAERYGFHSPLLTTRIATLEKLRGNTTWPRYYDKLHEFTRDNLKLVVILGIISLVIFTLIVRVFYKRIRQRRLNRTK